jgi:hypothetical protein
MRAVQIYEATKPVKGLYCCLEINLLKSNKLYYGILIYENTGVVIFNISPKISTLCFTIYGMYHLLRVSTPRHHPQEVTVTKVRANIPIKFLLLLRLECINTQAWIKLANLLSEKCRKKEVQQ